MIEPWLAQLARAAMRYRRLVLAGLLLPGLLGIAALRTPLDLSFAALMDRDHPEVARYFRASQRYGLGGRLLALVEGPEARLDEAVRTLRERLRGLREVGFVASPLPRPWLHERAPWWVPEELFESWVALGEAAAPGPAASAARRARAAALAQALDRALHELESRLVAPRVAGARFVELGLAVDPFDLPLDAPAFPRVRAAAREALAPSGASVRFAGMAAIVTQEQEATLARLRWLAPLSLLAVLLVLGRVERRPAVLAGSALVLLLAAGATLGIVGLLSGRLTLMESVFGVLVFGLGIDHAIHLRLRLLEERRAGRPLDDAIVRTVAGTGRATLAGAATSVGAFGLLALSPEPVFQRLGITGALGLALCWLMLVVALPAHWAGLEAVRPTAPRSTRGIGVTQRIARRALGAPRMTLVAALIAALLSGAMATRLRFETDLTRVFSRDIRAVETARRLHALFGLDPTPWLVPAQGLDEARRVVRAFEAEPLFGRASSVALLLPPDRDRRAARLRTSAPRRRALIARLERRAPQLPQPERAQEATVLALLRSLERAHALGPPRRETLPPSLAASGFGPAGEVLVFASRAAPHLDARLAARERRAARAIHPEATSLVAVLEALVGPDRPWIVPLTAAIAALVAVLVWLDLRSLRLVGLALLPVAAGTLLTLGLLGAAGFAFNTVTLVGVPLLLGLGVDDGIHLVHRSIEVSARDGGDGCSDWEAVIGSVGVPIAVTTATTCASVAALLFTRHPGIESVAILLGVGLPACWLASVTLLPVVASRASAASQRPDAGSGV